ncbi:MAG: hypothetical protein NHB32_14395 [Fischerella sp. CENA71]|nr:hypothetical protein [Fischerella sp. CENA71]
MTGLNRKAFEALVPTFTPIYEQTIIECKKSRQTAKGAGRKARLEKPQEKLFYILFYFKYYPTFDERWGVILTWPQETDLC